MLPDLERLIRLQELDNAAEEARRRIADIPLRVESMEARVADRHARLGAARQRLAANQAARREVEKDLAGVQSRLSRFKDHLMDVKTNKEYQAMQKEIAVADREVRGFEDRILELMLEADELTADAKATESDVAAAEADASQERKALEQERQVLEQELAQSATTRSELVAEMDRITVALFEHVARQRKGIAVVPARDGHCSFCHVRLRPQVFNDVRRNDSLIQCENCLRILYFAPTV